MNVYEDPQTPMRPVNNISWSPDSGSKMVVSYCSFGIEPDHSNIAYIWQIGKWKKREKALITFKHCTWSWLHNIRDKFPLWIRINVFSNCYFFMAFKKIYSR